MKKAFVIICHFFLFITACYGQQPLVSEFWINKNIDWKSPKTGDPELDSLIEASTANAIIFHSNGQFRMLSTNAGLWPPDTIHQFVEVFRVYSGTWEKTNNGLIKLRYSKSCEFFKGIREDSLKLNTIQLKLRNNEFEFEGQKYINGNKLSGKSKQRLIHYAMLPKKKLKQACN